MCTESTHAAEVEQLVARAATGDDAAMANLLERYRERLTRLVALRMDRRLQGRVDASDIVQEATIEAARRINEYARNPSMTFYVWLRWLTGDKLVSAHRHHLGAQKRDAAQEISIYRRAMPEADSISLARQLLGEWTSPTQAVIRAELQLLVQEVLNAMDPVDREVVVLRSFEGLSTQETADTLGIKRSTAGKRYISALKRLKQALDAIPEFKQDLK